MIPLEREYEHRLTSLEDRTKSNTHRINKLEESTSILNRLATSIEVMATKQETMSCNVERLTADMEQLKAEPGKRWKLVVEKAIYILVSGLLGYALSQIGL